MTSVILLMATALDDELQRRGVFGVGRRDCDRIIEAVVTRTAAVAAHLPSPSSPSASPPAEALDGGCISQGDASAVALSSSATPAPRTSDGGRDPSGGDAALAFTHSVTPAQMAYALLWREMRVSDRPFVREARKVLLAGLSPTEQSAAIAWVQRQHPLTDSEISGS